MVYPRIPIVHLKGLRKTKKVGQNNQYQEQFWKEYIKNTTLNRYCYINQCHTVKKREGGGMYCKRMHLESSSLQQNWLLQNRHTKYTASNNGSFWYVSNKMQHYSLFISGKLLYMFRVVSPPIIRSIHNCISIWYMLNRYCYLTLLWMSWSWFECGVGIVLICFCFGCIFLEKYQKEYTYDARTPER